MVKAEIQIILVAAFMIVLAIIAFSPKTSQTTGMAAYEVEAGQRVVVLLKETGTYGNLITGNAVGSAPTSLDEVKEQILDDVNEEGFLGIFGEDDVAQEQELATIPAMVVEATDEGIQKLLNHPLVEDVIPDFPLDLYLDDSVPLINAEQVHNITINNVPLKGQGVSVCYVDTGIQNDHPAFAGRILREKCFCQGCCGGGASESDTAADTHPQSHGTHVAGILGSDGQYKGVAPEVGYVAVKVCGNYCMLTDVLAGMDFCVAQRQNYNIKAMSISLGDNGNYKNQGQCPTYLDSAINAAYNNGIITAIASGNNGYKSGISYPACSPNAVAVGASTKADAMASYTNRGSMLDLLAPGSGIRSTIRPSTYGTLSGTSMATPHAAAAAAILWQYTALAGTPAGIDDIRNALQQSPTKINGSPRLDLIAALTALGWTNQTKRPWNITITSPISGSVLIAGNITLQANITGKANNATINWTINNSVVAQGQTATISLNCGNYTITATADDRVHTDSASTSIRIVPSTICSIELDQTGDGAIDIGDIVVLTQHNISCIAPTSPPTCLIELGTSNLTEQKTEELLAKIARREVSDVYGRACIVQNNGLI